MMKLTKEDLEMLPEWVSQSRQTVSFFEWLMEESPASWESRDLSVVKVLQKSCYFLYGSTKKERVLEIGKDLKFLGIFNRKDCRLYDLAELLQKYLKIPDTVTIFQKADALKKAKETADQRALQLTGRDWKHVLSASDCRKEELIPKISREEIRNCAKAYYQEGKTEEEIDFCPKVPVEDYFSDHCYLLYLERKEWVAEKIAWQWVLSNAAFISRQKIRYGCIRNEYREVKKEAEKKKRA